MKQKWSHFDYRFGSYEELKLGIMVNFVVKWSNTITWLSKSHWKNWSKWLCPTTNSTKTFTLLQSFIHPNLVSVQCIFLPKLWVSKSCYSCDGFLDKKVHATSHHKSVSSGYKGPLRVSQPQFVLSLYVKHNKMATVG